MKILRHSNNTERKELFCLIGEYFASAEIRKEFGEPMTSDDQYTWFIAVDGDTVQGFAAVKVAYAVGELNYCWVLPKYRGQGIGTRLLQARLEYLESLVDKIESTIIPNRLGSFERLGFKKVKVIGRWIRIAKWLHEKA